MSPEEGKEEKAFELPEFDETEFMRKEKRSAYTGFIAFGLAVVMGIASHFIWISLRETTSLTAAWWLTFLIAIFAFGFLIFIFKAVKIDTSNFGRKGWFGTAFLYVFTILAILIISANPPFYDSAAPDVQSVVVPAVIEDGDVSIAAFVTDNAGDSDVKITIEGPGGYIITPTLSNDGALYWCSITPKDDGTYTYTVTATDKNGLETVVSDTFKKGGTVVSLCPEPDGDAVMVDSPTDSISYFVTDDLVKEAHSEDVSPTTVFDYAIWANCRVVPENGIPRYIPLENSDGWYKSEPRYEGWVTGRQDVRFTAKILVNFTGGKSFEGELLDNSNYTFDIDEKISAVVGTTKISFEQEFPVAPSPLRTPGFEAIFVVAAATIVGLVFRKKNANKKD